VPPQKAEFERAMIREGVRAGLVHARDRGSVGGRRLKLTPAQEAKPFDGSAPENQARQKWPGFLASTNPASAGCSSGVALRLRRNQRGRTSNYVNYGSNEGYAFYLPMVSRK